ncbi:MAG: hypothetical protein H7226_02405, partial [Salinibacterium sp.]|nr:hypothetical protein [Salinibacterium sp.]
RDVALVTPFTETNGLWDTVAPLADTTAALATSTDVWAIELSTGSTIPADVSFLEEHGYELDSTTLIHRTTIYHLFKE